MANTVKVEVLATVKMIVSVSENNIDEEDGLIATAIRVASREIDQRIVAVEARVIDH